MPYNHYDSHIAWLKSYIGTELPNVPMNDSHLLRDNWYRDGTSVFFIRNGVNVHSYQSNGPHHSPRIADELVKMLRTRFPKGDV